MSTSVRVRSNFISSQNHLSNETIFLQSTFVSNDIKEQMFLRNSVTFYAINSHQIKLPVSDNNKKYSFYTIRETKDQISFILHFAIKFSRQM